MPRQQLQNDREHVLQLQGNFDIPWDMVGTVIYRLLDGKPYSRQVTAGSGGSQSPINQGGQGVIVVPADSNVRLPTQNVLDLAIGKRIDAGPTTVKIDLQLFNVFNEDSHDWWQTLNVAPGDSFVPDGYIFPRPADAAAGGGFLGSEPRFGPDRGRG